ncbi:MAG TPA: RNA 2',3'-cyclic phosphodiesterase [Pirellulaceae bacterium]|nr:RNA 2',3'-cyclic phosphodiesterase [Pirellulaceae bacterium]
MQSIRTFIAFEVGNDVKSRAADLIKRLKKSEADVKWVAPQEMHITLKFLGDVPNVEVPDICRIAQQVAAEFEPFDIDFLGAGAFPEISRPKTIWLGIAPGEDFDRLQALNERLETRLHEDLGFARERRRFQPHLTLGRVNTTTGSTQALSEILATQTEFDGSLAEIDELLIFASFQEKQGPVYNVMGRAELQRKR